MNNKHPEDIHKPFLREADGSDTAILMVHGIFGSPVQFESMGQMLYEHGFTVMSILLFGHGGSAKDFSKAKASIWKREVSQAAAFLKQRYKHVFFIGHSMGGLLTMIEAIENNADGVILMSAPMRVKVSVRTFGTSIKILWGRPKKDDDFLQSYRQAFSVQKGPAWTYIGWVPRMVEVLMLIRKTHSSLCKVHFPVFIIQPRRDETVSYKACKYLSTD